MFEKMGPGEQRNHGSQESVKERKEHHTCQSPSTTEGSPCVGILPEVPEGAQQTDQRGPGALTSSRAPSTHTELWSSEQSASDPPEGLLKAEPAKIILAPHKFTTFTNKA